ncbi:MAG TPA: YoaK family protein [Streptosporangiaceae bacterium]|nr:YoaK family protein [Streptosporangiaceae bacterium]
MTERTPAAGAAAGKDSGTLLAILLVLTTFSGVLDAVSYLGLGHVFTANMTGNVVILGFATAGAKGFSESACLTSLAAFLTGALSAGRGSRLLAARRLLLLAVVAECLVTAVAAAVALSVVTVSAGWPRFTVIALLAFGMGVRNATVRHIGVQDLPTTVLTMTLTGIAADSSLAGGDNALAGRRGGAVIAMLGGAFVGALSFLHLGAGPTLLWDSGCVLAAAVALVASNTLRDQVKS